MWRQRSSAVGLVRANGSRCAEREKVHDDDALVTGPHISLLTPYTGGNLGDGAIQDAMIANLRCRLPGARFSGICLDCEGFREKHGLSAFPLCVTDRPFYQMWSRGKQGGGSGGNAEGRRTVRRHFRRRLERMPKLLELLERLRRWGLVLPREALHCWRAYRYLRTTDLLIVSGGGQLDEEWGGPWGHPYALFKWAVAAWVARVPYAIASVGCCQVKSFCSRVFLRAALKMSRYRSYRETNTRSIVASLMQKAAQDSVVPDLALSLSPSMMPEPAGIRTIAGDRPTVAISPIAYAKPKVWPNKDCSLYVRYLQEMATVVSVLLNRGFFLVFVYSALEDDESVIPELLDRLDDESKVKLTEQAHFPAISCWKDFVASVQDVDLLIASRLHSTLLGFVTETPTVAISFDPKVNWAMEDAGQGDYLLDIHDFTAKDVIRKIEHLRSRKEVVARHLTMYQQGNLCSSARQYDVLAKLTISGRREFS